jgi:hypothetical protein
VIEKNFESICKDDIDSLIRDEVPESKTLEYKLELPKDGKEDKKEFLADVSAFANAAGGDLLYGISEKRDSGTTTGIPESAVGIKGFNEDSDIRRLESMIRDGISPRLNVKIKKIDGFQDGLCLLIRIPDSSAKPHMLSNKSSRFYSRNSKGKYPLDVGEIRSAFLQSESLSAKIRNFRLERIARIVSGDLPIPMKDSPKLVFHIVPLMSLNPSYCKDIHEIEQKSHVCNSMYGDGAFSRYNIDGVLKTSVRLPSYNSESYRYHFDDYFQIFRNTMIEFVNSPRIEESIPDSRTNSKRCVSGLRCEAGIIRAFRSYLEFCRSLDIDPPFILMLTFVGVKGIEMTPGGTGFFPNEGAPFDRDTMVFPEIVLNETSERVDRLLKPLFDIIWQSAGWSHSMSYDTNGNWVGPLT